ncbi:3-deoxy-manno-octulosonate cytidylyltransferase [Leptospira sp. GIMC2001]|uniref:3-deoxy-manno-octulosonate cytidylyltransferase n=1 Tax=Leptospira sp. GIMC2001 TaxID=1513297 RepID=UPI00234BDC7F|nr:3-deoxy-manno-octulosonate cytidylyltransferase [Leptospira sp. GIMC2001]WCL49601.1 3-deoxy-manno-octulosonate cytidylyltransferase [Leptospira sp. GIMC2001]
MNSNHSINSESKVIAVIPARYGSTRFPGKPLTKIGTKTMIRWTYESTALCKNLSNIIVATDDQRIYDEVTSFGGQVMMTSSNHPTGTDRIIEVVQNLGDKVNPASDVVINIQGDEPGIETELIEGVIEQKLKNRNWVITTAAVPMSQTEATDPNRVKVIFDQNGRAMYFSRAMIPHPFKSDSPFYQKEISENKSDNVYYRHLGMYCYNIDFLLQYGSLPLSSWESLESLEQLRVMQTGYEIGIFVADKATLSIDRPEDVSFVEAEFVKRGWI